MNLQENMQERLLTMCRQMARRRTAGQKKRALVQLSQMMSALGYPVTLTGKPGLRGQALLCGEPETSAVVIAADLNLREARLLMGRQKLLHQSENRKQQLENITASLIMALMLAGMGVLLCLAAARRSMPLLLVLAGLAFVAAFWLSRRQAYGNAGKNAALFAMLECARLAQGRAAFCFIDEAGTELGLQQLRQTCPHNELLYINQLGREKGLCLIMKGECPISRKACAEAWPQIKLTALETAENDSIIRVWDRGFLISTADPETLTCEMPGGQKDLEMDCGQIQEAVELIGWLIDQTAGQKVKPGVCPH